MNQSTPDAGSKIGFVLLTVFKDENERAVIQRSHQRQCDSYDEVWDEAKSQMGKKRELSKRDKDQQAPPTDLSIFLEDGDVTYVIELDSGTRAAFGPSAHPIMIMPFMLGRQLLDDVALVHKDSGGRIVRTPAQSIGAFYSEVPKNAALTFRCSRSAIAAAWDEIVKGAGHYDPRIRVPFFLNLFDKKTGKPVWTYGEDYHPGGRHDHEHNGQEKDRKDRVHGGIHPNTVTQFLYYP
jgi:hypothetical protein